MRFENESMWLRQNQIAKLFGKDRTVITKHINKIFRDKEVDKKSNVHFLHIANSDKPVTFNCREQSKRKSCFDKNCYQFVE